MQPFAPPRNRALSDALSISLGELRSLEGSTQSVHEDGVAQDGKYREEADIAQAAFHFRGYLFTSTSPLKAQECSLPPVKSWEGTEFTTAKLRLIIVANSNSPESLSWLTNS